MVRFLIHCFARGSSDENRIRSVTGYVCGAVGIFLNIVLFCAKLAVGMLTGSISITADAFNNLSDAGSSAMTLFGFLWAGKRADAEHPFGHGRIEYLSGILISVLIILVGGELFLSSVKKIFSPEESTFSVYVLIVLLCSILVKLYMYFYNRSCGKKIHSETLLAAAADSRGDCIATLAVLLCALISYFTSVNLDAYVGVAVSVLILVSGIRSASETASPLLGKAPDPAFVSRVIEILQDSPATEGYHDMVVHDYGPSKRFLSLHMEVDGSKNIYTLHDEVDLVERRISQELGCEAVIHMDPIDLSNPTLAMISEKLHEKAREYPGATVHDIRMVPGVSHTNIIFDLSLTPELFSRHTELEDSFSAFAREISPAYCTVIQSEISYTDALAK